MAKFNVRVRQVYRVEREIIVTIEADTPEEALEDQAANESPDFNHPDWRTGWELENEEVHPL
jgi:hypothetical protein